MLAERPHSTFEFEERCVNRIVIMMQMKRSTLYTIKS